MVSWGDVSSVVQYSPRGKDVARKPPVQALVQKVEEVDTRKLDWSVVCYIQFLCVPMSQAQAIISVAPQIQLLVSAGARHRLGTAKGPEDDDVARETPSNNILDVSFWPPRKPKQHTSSMKHTRSFPRLKSVEKLQYRCVYIYIYIYICMYVCMYVCSTAVNRDGNCDTDDLRMYLIMIATVIPLIAECM